MEKHSARPGGNVIVFDSGIGGLNLLYHCQKKVPWAHYFYVSDSQNVPYGNRPPEEIAKLAFAALSGIEKLNPAALVVACNTVTAHCIDALRQRFTFPVIGIQPAVKQAAKVGGKCLVLATDATVKSTAFLNLVKAYAPADTKIFGSKALADYVEKNVLSLPDELPENLLPDLSPDTVVLGCTHYAYVKEQIIRRYNCPVFDGLEGTAANFRNRLGISDHFCPATGNYDHQTEETAKITFLGGNCEYNKQIMKYLFTKLG